MAQCGFLLVSFLVYMEYGLIATAGLPMRTQEMIDIEKAKNKARIAKQAK